MPVNFYSFIARKSSRIRISKTTIRLGHARCLTGLTVEDDSLYNYDDDVYMPTWKPGFPRRDTTTLVIRCACRDKLQTRVGPTDWWLTRGDDCGPFSEDVIAERRRASTYRCRRRRRCLAGTLFSDVADVLQQSANDTRHASGRFVPHLSGATQCEVWTLLRPWRRHSAFEWNFKFIKKYLFTYV